MTKTPDQRAAEAIAIEPDPRDRDAIARARSRVAEEVRLSRGQLARLAQGAYRPQELTQLFETMDGVVQRLKRLAARLDQLETMAADALEVQLAEDMPGAVLDRETGRITPADHIRQAEGAQAAEARACEHCGEPLAEDRYRPGWWFHAETEAAAACKRRALEAHLTQPRSNAELAQHLRDVHKASGGWVSEPVPAASVALADELARMHRLTHTGELRTS